MTMALYVSSNLYIRGSQKDLKKFLKLLPIKAEEIKSQFFEKLTGSNQYKEATFFIDELAIKKDSIYIQTSAQRYNPVELIKIISSRHPELVFELVCFTMEVPSAWCQIIKYGDVIGKSTADDSDNDNDIDIYDFYEAEDEVEDDGEGEWNYDGLTEALVQQAYYQDT
jgi:hypothetical protein